MVKLDISFKVVVKNALSKIISFNCVPPAVHIVAALMHLITSQQSRHDMAIFVIVSTQWGKLLCQVTRPQRIYKPLYGHQYFSPLANKVYFIAMVATSEVILF